MSKSRKPEPSIKEPKPNPHENEPQRFPPDHKPHEQELGEGNYRAGRDYDKAAAEFAKSGRVEQAAEDAAPDSDREAAELSRAEQEGRARSKGEDPALHVKGLFQDLPES